MFLFISLSLLTSLCTTRITKSSGFGIFSLCIFCRDAISCCFLWILSFKKLSKKSLKSHRGNAEAFKWPDHEGIDEGVVDDVGNEGVVVVDDVGNEGVVVDDDDVGTEGVVVDDDVGNEGVVVDVDVGNEGVVVDDGWIQEQKGQRKNSLGRRVSIITQRQWNHCLHFIQQIHYRSEYSKD